MRLSGLLGKKWLIPLLVILLIVLAVETAILVIVVSQSVFGGRQVFPGISVFRYVAAGCQTLVWSVESTTGSNRSVLFTCPKVSGNDRAALVLGSWFPDLSSFSFEANPYSPRYAVVPTFSLPPGYLMLSLTSQSCSGGWSIPLKTGKEIGVGGYSSSYNYCAVIDSSVSRVESFSIDWSNGTPPIVRPTPYTVYVTPTTETLTAGQKANYTITLASVSSWTGNVSFSSYGAGKYPINRAGGPINWTLTPSTVTVKPDGPSYTKLTVTTRPCTNLSDYCTPANLWSIYLTTYAGCLVNVPGGWCADGYGSVDFSVDLNVV